jgi:hypothetical protein
MPTPTPASSTMIADSTGRFGLIQVLDAWGRAGKQMTQSQIQQEAPYYDSVWGAFFPQYWNASHSGMILSRYYLPFEDAYLMSGNDLNWFKTNHPDWILYGCDQNNNPTTHYAWSGTGFPNDVPLDIHNPAVVAYQLANIKSYLQSNGYNALAIDNTVFINYLESPNPMLESGQRTQSGWYGCGIYQNGILDSAHFVRRYTGFDNTNDATFNADVNNWVAQARAALSPLGIKIIVSHPPIGFSPNANEQTLVSNIDGLLDENGFTHYGNPVPTNTFAQTLNWMQLLQSRHIAFFVTDYWCLDGTDPTTNQPCGTDPSQLTAREVDYSLASYAIGNNGGADVFISPNGGAGYSFRPEYLTKYGGPCGSSTQSGAIFTRSFSGGFAVVNTSTSTQSVSLPAHNYRDIEGRAVSNPLQVGAQDGYMLIRSDGSGCP